MAGRGFATTTWKYDLAGRDTVRTVVWCRGPVAARRVNAFATHFTYDVAGRLSKQYTASSDGTWYSWDATAGGAFNAIDELLSYTGVDVGTGNPSTAGCDRARTFTYTTDGTRRLAPHGDLAHPGQCRRVRLDLVTSYGNRPNRAL